MKPENTYKQLLSDIKHQIAKSRFEAVQTVNKKLIQLYWQIGLMIHQRQETHGWGKSIVEKLAIDLQKSFPHRNGLSARNLWEMRRFYHFYREKPILQQLVAEIPWSHNLLIMSKTSDDEEAKYYLESTAKFGWSRNVPKKITWKLNMPFA